MPAKTFLDIIATRRSIYKLGAHVPLVVDMIDNITQEVILSVPWAFNSQTTRIVLLLEQEHSKLWDVMKKPVKVVAPPEQWPNTELKLEGFKNAFGTVSLTSSSR